jgi:hypothetical protein
LQLKPYLFTKNNKLQLVYAGAMLPKAHAPLEAIFQSVKANIEQFSDVEFHFIGTGKTPDDEQGFNIRPLAEKYGLWQTIVFEYPKRIPYLDVLIHLEAAGAVFILGSTEPHYTPSKIYQGVLSGKPVLAVLHEQSTAVKVIRGSGAGLVLSFNGEEGLGTIISGFNRLVADFMKWRPGFDQAKINIPVFEQYSAKAITMIGKTTEPGNGWLKLPIKGSGR